MATPAKEIAQWVLIVLAVVLGAVGACASTRANNSGTALTKWIATGTTEVNNDTGVIKWMEHQYVCHEHPAPSCGGTSHVAPPPPPPKW
jgi:hypothetical protein